MDGNRLFFKVFIVDENEQPIAYRGSAFPITPNGDLLTCRHVINADYDPAKYRIAVFDNNHGKFLFPEEIVTVPDNQLDIALLRRTLKQTQAAFFPFLSPSTLVIGENVYSYGFFAFGGQLAEIQGGYFSGKIVSFIPLVKPSSLYALMLPYTFIEGMSGCPVLTYHNGPKVVGLGYGNHIQRIITSDILEYKDSEREYRETTNRIVEFGLAYHAVTVIAFLQQIGVTDVVISTERISVPGLE